MDALHVGKLLQGLRCAVNFAPNRQYLAFLPIGPSTKHLGFKAWCVLPICESWILERCGIGQQPMELTSWFVCRFLPHVNSSCVHIFIFSYFLCGQSVVRRFLSPPQPRRRPSPARPPPFTHEPTRACQSPPSTGSGRSGLTPYLPQAHLETGQNKNSLCLEAAQYNSPVSMDLLRLKRSGGEKKKKKTGPPLAYRPDLTWPVCHHLLNITWASLDQKGISLATSGAGARWLPKILLWYYAHKFLSIEGPGFMGKVSCYRCPRVLEFDAARIFSIQFAQRFIF